MGTRTGAGMNGVTLTRGGQSGGTDSGSREHPGEVRGVQAQQQC